MKNAHRIKDTAGAPGTGAEIVVGELLARKNTVRAEVLARFLDHERMTGMEGVFKASTTRLSAVVHALGEYGWPIERHDKVVGSSDGRIPTIREYWLSPDVIERAAAAGAGAWCAEVKAARRALRAKAEQARRDAAKANATAAARRRTAMTRASGQADFFDGACP